MSETVKELIKVAIEVVGLEGGVIEIEDDNKVFVISLDGANHTCIKIR